MSDWLFDHMPHVLVAMLLILLVGGGALAYYCDAKEEREWQAFKAACEQDRKPYECQALWRGMHPPEHSATPPVIVVH